MKSRDRATTTTQPVRARGARWRSGYWLVLVLIALSYAICAAQSSANPSASALLVQLVTVAVTLWVAEVGAMLRRVGWVVLGVAGIAVVGVWAVGAEGRILDVLMSGASMLAYLIAPVAIIAHQARKVRVDLQTLLAAICAYILVGMFFTFVFNFIALLSAVPTFGDEYIDSLSTQLFFSFATLTTTGYGNIVPIGAGVQSIAIAEAITGQLFLVIAVARVVSGWTPRVKL